MTLYSKVWHHFTIDAVVYFSSFYDLCLVPRCFIRTNKGFSYLITAAQHPNTLLLMGTMSGIYGATGPLSSAAIFTLKCERIRDCWWEREAPLTGDSTAHLPVSLTLRILNATWPGDVMNTTWWRHEYDRVTSWIQSGDVMNTILIHGRGSKQLEEQWSEPGRPEWKIHS